ncbi:tubulin polymerization-promoting protein homolog [Frieseomelitta varia]|uniref:tubulin polymerization-promoting protein homolog n=1 Tax=Frieseomelitta varia TaxID=561572 RepID=UPI001CB6956C|nr:tubulin polymerization-promoting protein homolog [Frieseomelitta varia]
MTDDFFLKKKDEPEIIPLNEMFKAYCEMDIISFEQNVDLLPLSQSDKWLISARILDMVTLTTTDTGLAFFKFRRRALSFEEYLQYLKDLAESRNIDFEEMKYKMQTCGKPKKAA